MEIQDIHIRDPFIFSNEKEQTFKQMDENI
jgi:hypothetical protein